MKKLIAVFFALIIGSAIFSGCSSAYTGNESPRAAMSMAAAAPFDASYDEAGFSTQETAVEAEDSDIPEVPMETGGGGGEAAVPSAKNAADNRKIIKNVDIQLQTLSFDSGISTIEKIAENFGGFIQDSYIEGRDMYNERGARTASFTVRVPVENLDGFVNSLGGEFNMISKSQNSQDITDTYYDSKARLDMLEVQEERLLEMLKSSAELEYLLQVEKELMNVRYEIESITSSLNRMDSYVELSTANIRLYEVVRFENVSDVPVTFIERVSKASAESWKNFVYFLQDFTVGIISALPFLLVLFVIAMIIVLALRGSKKSRAAKKDKLKNQYEQRLQQMSRENGKLAKTDTAADADKAESSKMDPRQ